MEKTTLINGNGYKYEREIPKFHIFGYMNDVALENLRQQTGIDFKQNAWGDIVGQAETWEQFSKVFLAYDWLTHDQNNMDGNIMYLRSNMNVPIDHKLYYYKNGERFLGVDGCRG